MPHLKPKNCNFQPTILHFIFNLSLNSKPHFQKGTKKKAPQKTKLKKPPRREIVRSQRDGAFRFALTRIVYKGSYLVEKSIKAKLNTRTNNPSHKSLDFAIELVVLVVVILLAPFGRGYSGPGPDVGHRQRYRDHGYSSGASVGV